MFFEGLPVETEVTRLHQVFVLYSMFTIVSKIYSRLQEFVHTIDEVILEVVKGMVYTSLLEW